MKREVSTFLYLVGIGLLLFFIYAMVGIGMTMHNAIAVHQGELSTLCAAAVRFLLQNKEIVLATLVVLVVAKLLTRAPGPLRIKGH